MKSFLRTPYPDWDELLKNDRSVWQKAIQNASSYGPKILIATGTGKHVPVATLDSYLAAALTLRGAEVHFLLCDEVLPACEQCLVTHFPDQMEFVKDGPSKKICPTCFAPAERAYASMGLRVHRYSQYLTGEARKRADKISAETPFAEIENYIFEGLAVGEHAKAGALRFYAKGLLSEETYGEGVLRRYFKASLLTAMALKNLFGSIKFAAASFHHGIYVPQGIVGEVARACGVRVANWQVAYRKKCFIFSHNETYHHKLLDEPVSNWENIDWNDKLDGIIKDYLKSRWSGTNDWIWFHETPREDIDAIKKETGIDFSKPCVGMLTNVMWDAQLHYKANAFQNMLDWALETIQYFNKRPELQLIIRVHPAEVRGGIPSRQPIEKEIRKEWPVLPPNVYIVSAESQLSTYVLMTLCDSCIIYGTKTGVELTSMGIPVIVAGEAWIRNKGLTMDASTVEEYLAILDKLPLGRRLEPALSERARKYAFHFFYRRMIPISYMNPTDGWPPYKIEFSSLDQLMPGRDAGTDAICDGIMKGSEFVYAAERFINNEGGN